MRTRSKRLWLVTLVALLLAAAAGASEPPTLRSNPFARPPSVVTAPILSEARLDGDPSGLELRATLVSTQNRLANVGGKTVRPGDEVQGYKLLQVFEDRAVFARQGKHLTIVVKPDLEENDE